MLIKVVFGSDINVGSRINLKCSIGSERRYMILKIIITLGVMLISLYALFCMFVALITSGKKIKPDKEHPKLDIFFEVSRMLGYIFSGAIALGISFGIFYALLWL